MTSKRLNEIRLNHVILGNTLANHDGRTPFSIGLVYDLHAAIGELLVEIDEADAITKDRDLFFVGSRSPSHVKERA